MKLALNDSEIREAIIAFVDSQGIVVEGKKITVDIKGSRKGKGGTSGKGFSASVSIDSDEETAVSESNEEDNSSSLFNNQE